jgi:hypothetical protein
MRLFQVGAGMKAASALAMSVRLLTADLKSRPVADLVLRKCVRLFASEHCKSRSQTSRSGRDNPRCRSIPVLCSRSNGNRHRQTRIHGRTWRHGARMAAGGTSAAAGNAYGRLCRRRVGRYLCASCDRVPQGPQRARLCRRPKPSSTAGCRVITIVCQHSCPIWFPGRWLSSPRPSARNPPQITVGLMSVSGSLASVTTHGR